MKELGIVLMCNIIFNLKILNIQNMIIECNAISQNINELLIAFQDCNKIKNSDLRRLVELVSGSGDCVLTLT